MHEERTATTVWTGGLTDGHGELSVASGAIGPVPVSWPARAGTAAGRTSPEELLAAAHASCYAMALSHELAQAGATPERLEVACTVTFSDQDGAPTVSSSALRVRAAVAGLDQAAFRTAAEAAKTGCPMSRALVGLPSITLEATLA